MTRRRGGQRIAKYNFKHPHVREAIYVKRILKCISAKTRIQVNSVQVLTSLIRDIASKLVLESFQLLEHTKKKTLTAREIQCAVRLLFPTELCRFAISTATKDVTKISMSKFSPPTPPTPTKPSDNSTTPTPTLGTIIDSSKSNIPTSYLKSNIKRMNFNYRISKLSLVYLSSVITYLLCEILELANNTAFNSKRTLIQPKDILMSIHNDEELYKMFSKVTIAGGGVVPNMIVLGHFSKKKKTF